MKFFILTILLVSSFAKADVPKVVCELKYDDKTVKSEPVTENGVQVVNDKALLNSTLTQVCAADGGHCIDAYKITSTLDLGDATAFNVTDIVPLKFGHTSQFLSLYLNKKNAIAQCRVVKNQ